MIDIIEIQQMVSNLSAVEKVASTPQVLAVNSNSLIKKEMDASDVKKLDTVVELSEVLEPIEDKEGKSGKNNESEAKSESESESEEKSDINNGENSKKSNEETIHHVNVMA